jgi:NAD(P)-dependent dehydrogenase (short-subunit alcohol dehydrogenase family)
MRGSVVTDDLSGKVVLVTGAAGGIGTCLAEMAAGAGASVLLADLDSDAVQRLASRLGGAAVRCDVTRPEDSASAVRAAVERYGGLDVALLNAGVVLDLRLGPDFDLAAYRREMGVNIDGPVFGVNAALPALRQRGGGRIVVTASLAGLTGTTSDPIYCASKHAAVGLVRALGPRLREENVLINAVCPGFTDTTMVDRIRPVIADAQIPLLEPSAVAEAVFAVLASDRAGEAWYVQPGRPAAPFAFRGIPGPRDPGGQPVGRAPSPPGAGSAPSAAAAR